jgi:hypothetical protein
MYIFPMDGHKGFGKSALTLDNVSPVIIDVEAGEARKQKKHRDA